MNDSLMILETVRKVFIYADARHWEGLVSEVFAPELRVDYSSFGGQAGQVPATQLVDNWKQFFSRIPHTHHQLGNELLRREGGNAHVFCYGTAGHYFPNASGSHVWTVVGTYDFELQHGTEGWRIHSMIFHFRYQDGNTHIPALLQQA